MIDVGDGRWSFGIPNMASRRGRRKGAPKKAPKAGRLFRRALLNSLPEGEIKVQEAEIQRRERELAATVLKDAEAQRKRIETLAEAERQRLALEATGRADAQKAEGSAAAEIIRLKGAAEAEIIRAKGQSEAEAMQLKANAYLEYNEAAVIDKLLGGLPDVVRAFAEPLSKVDKITVVSTGGDGGAGVNKITADMAQMVAQVPALIEWLTGKKMSDLMQQVRRIESNNTPPVKAPAEVSIGASVKGSTTRRGD